MVAFFMAVQLNAKENNTIKQLDTANYPSLTFKAKKIAVTRDLFAIEYKHFTTVKLEGILSEFDAFESDVGCQPWSNTLTYYGTFSVGQEDSVMVKSLGSNVIKIGVGESFHVQNENVKTLTVTDIKRDSFIAGYAGVSVCSFKKVNY
jgi:hypothetical protein